MFSQALRFQNYRLRLDWRIPGGDVHPDAGIFLAKYPDKAADKYAGWERGALAIQVQIEYGSVGMLRSQGGPMSGGRIVKKSDDPYPDVANRGGWNQLMIEERDGKLRVWLNGVRVNSAIGLDPKALTTIGLSCEGYTIDFRNITLEPLPGARVGRAPEKEGE